VEELNSSDKIQGIKEYFTNERQHLIDEVEKFKKIS
jgi:hypothetical protein